MGLALKQTKPQTQQSEDRQERLHRGSLSRNTKPNNDGIAAKPPSDHSSHSAPRGAAIFVKVCSGVTHVVCQTERGGVGQPCASHPV